MFGLPIDAVSLLCSTCVGGVRKMLAKETADKAEQHKISRKEKDNVQESVDSARNYYNPNAAWIRRVM